MPKPTQNPIFKPLWLVLANGYNLLKRTVTIYPLSKDEYSKAFQFLKIAGQMIKIRVLK